MPGSPQVLAGGETTQPYPPGWVSVASGGQVNLTGGYLYLHAPLSNSVNPAKPQEFYILKF